MKKYLIEAIGTFFLVLTIPLAIVNLEVLAPLAIGAVLMVMVYAGGHISGGHYNPAVTLGVRTTKNISTKELVMYRIAQLVGALVAGGIAVFFLGNPLIVNASTTPLPQIILAEFLFTFALVYVVLMTAVHPSAKGNSYYGVAIGMTVLVGAFTVGSISGGAFNPAVVVGGYLNGLFTPEASWMHLIGQLIGGLAAGALYVGVLPHAVKE